jgi:hypothetical protein
MTLLLTILLGAIGSILAAELLDICPWLTQKLLARAAKRVPAAYRERYLAEWQAELDYMKTRTGKLFMLTWAAGVYVSSGRLAREVSDIPPTDRLGRAQRARVTFPKPPVFYGGSIRLDGVDDLDVPTVIRDLSDDSSSTASDAADVSADRGFDLRVRTSKGVFELQMKHQRNARLRNSGEE